MPQLTPEQERKLQRLANALDGGPVAVLTILEEIEQAFSVELDELKAAIPKLREAKDGKDGEKGEKGDKGEPGQSIKGDKGDKGDPGKDGKDGKDGRDGKDGMDGKDGRDGLDGQDGFVDTATIAYLEDLIKSLDKKIEKRGSKYSDGLGLIVRQLRAGSGVTIDDSNQEYPIISATGGPGGASAWGDITGTLADQTDLQTALNAKAATSHSHAISDVTGLQTALDGKAATLGSDDNYVTDAEKVKLSNLSGTNTGDNATNTQYSGLAASKQDTLVSGTNIKTINGASVLGSGDLSVGGGVADGDKGDITVSASGATWTIDNGAVTLAKQADMATASVVYRKTAGAGAPEVQTLATLKTDLGLTGTNSGDQTSIAGITGTKAQFDTAVTDGNFMYVGDAPTSHTHTASAITDFDTEVSNNTDVAANTTARHTHSNKAVLDATTASFTTADETKLDGIETAADVTDATNVAAAGAIMDGDFSTNGLMKRTGAGTYATAVAGTDYIAPDTQLTDLAALSYTGNGLKFLRVNTGETAWELATIAGGGDVTGDDTSTTTQNIVAYSGTGGKNITELTGTQGDILYHNGTSWAKLGAGTSGQFLRTNGAAANPSWAFSKLYNRSTGNQGAGFSSDTYLTGSSISIPNSSLKAGTIYKTWFRLSKTAAGTATPILTLRFGTNGSTADTARCTFTFTAGTAAADDGIFEVWATFDTVGSGSSAVLRGTARCTHKLSVTGITGTAAVSETEHAVSGGFDSTVSNSIIGLSVNGGASAAWTVQHVMTEMENFA